jgi:NTE family protein
VTLVIGAGSVKCAAAIGVVKVLAEAGIGVERVVGCSAGAIFGSLVAQQLTVEASFARVVKLWTSNLTAQRNTRALLSVVAPRLFGFSLTKFGLRDDRLVNAQLRDAFGDANIEDTPIPLHITATDFNTGDLVELSSGPIHLAIRASISIPFAFAPVELDGKVLIDGCVSDPLPVSVAMKHGASVIVAVGFESPIQTRVTSAGRFAFQLSSLMSNNLLRARMSFHSMVHHSEVINIIPEFGQRIGLFDTDKLPYIVEAGERAAREQIGYIRRLLDSEDADPTIADR